MLIEVVMEDQYEDLVDLGDIQENTEEEDNAPQVSLFDLIKDISEHGKYMDTYFEEHKAIPPQYNSFMVLRIFAEHMDTILLANEINKFWQLPDEMQWRFLKNTIYKKKRYGYTKKLPVDNNPIETLAKYFHCSEKEMRKNIKVLSKEKIYEILEEIEPEKYAKKQRRNNKSNGK